MQAKDSVALIGFGTFSVAERAARNGVNPKTREKIKIAQTTKAKFKVGKALDDAIKGVKKEGAKTKSASNDKKAKDTFDKTKKSKPKKAMKFK